MRSRPARQERVQTVGERTHSELKEKKRLYTIRVQLKAGRRRVSCADPSLLDISVLDVWFRRGTAGSVPSADRRVYGCSFCDWFGAFGVWLGSGAKSGGSGGLRAVWFSTTRYCGSGLTWDLFCPHCLRYLDLELGSSAL